MQAEVILAAARRELDSARAILDVLGGSIVDCTAAVVGGHCPPSSWAWRRWRRSRGVV
jgi:hypothetical protein